MTCLETGCIDTEGNDLKIMTGNSLAGQVSCNGALFSWIDCGKDELKEVKVGGMSISYIIPSEFHSLKWADLCPKRCGICGNGSAPEPTAPESNVTSSCAAEAQVAKDAGMSNASVVGYVSCLNTGCKDFAGSELSTISGMPLAGSLACDGPLTLTVKCDQKFESIEFMGVSAKSVLPESMSSLTWGQVCPKHCNLCTEPNEVDGAAKHGSMQLFILGAIAFFGTKY